MNPIFEKTTIRIEFNGPIDLKDELARGIVGVKIIPYKVTNQIPLPILHGLHVHALPQSHVNGTATYHYLPTESETDNDTIEIQLVGPKIEDVVQEILARTNDSLHLYYWHERKIAAYEVVSRTVLIDPSTCKESLSV